MIYLIVLLLTITGLVWTIEMIMTVAGKMQQKFSFLTHSLWRWPKLDERDKFLSSSFHFHDDRSRKNATIFVLTLLLSQWPELEKATTGFLHTNDATVTAFFWWFFQDSHHTTTLFNLRRSWCYCSCSTSSCGHPRKCSATLNRAGNMRQLLLHFSFSLFNWPEDRSVI